MASNDHRSTARVLDILKLVAASPEGYTLTQLSGLLNAPKSSLSPILGTMRGHHFLSYSTKTQLYRVGPAAFQVGMSYVNRTNLLGIVEREMEQLVEDCLETAHFAVLDAEGNVVYLLKKDSPQMVRMKSMVGLTLPAYGTGIGKALLIDKTLEELKALYPNGLQPLTEKTITDYETLYGQLCAFRENDISVESEESNLDICCQGVALRKHGEIVAALSIAVPLFRYDEAKHTLVREKLLEYKQKLEPVLRDIQFDLTV